MASKKEPEVKVILEFNGKSVNVADVAKAAKDSWSKNHKGDVKDFNLYLKSEESKAYYVINKEDAGAVDL
jgi:hypothetical protein